MPQTQKASVSGLKFDAKLSAEEQLGKAAASAPQLFQDRPRNSEERRREGTGWKCCPPDRPVLLSLLSVPVESIL